MGLLSERQIQTIGKYVEELRPRLEEEFASPQWQKDRHERATWVREILSGDHLPNLTPEEFGTLVRGLWASRIWGNLDYLVNKILSQNDFEAIQQEFRELLYDEAPLAERFDSFNISDEGDDRVLITGVRGEPPTGKLKISMNILSGYRNTMTVLLTGLDIEKKAKRIEKDLFDRLGG